MINITFFKIIVTIALVLSYSATVFHDYMSKDKKNKTFYKFLARKTLLFVGATALLWGSTELFKLFL
ncbi:hypothetical protein MKL18_13525 [Enterococcus faecalis]|uniref:hypothetical protein n=1 Tax=Enterococcus faecalis TaxID=1351 RepID=UPI001F06C35F|nr:hypothetical protein [Enterococcus faecalis]MCH1672951.1 hypothetical protein [Enterococcus faecalis]